MTPVAGDVRLGNEPLVRLSRGAIARRIAVVPQVASLPFNARVEEIVGLGRLPHEDPLRGPRAPDRAAIASAIDRVGLGRLIGRNARELSLGERQLVLLAVAVAQGAPIIVLDEPTVHLDIRHQVEVMELLVDLNERDGRTIVAVLHDLHLAARFMPRIAVLAGGRVAADGPPEIALGADVVRDVFGVAPESLPIGPWSATAAPGRAGRAGRAGSSMRAALAFLTRIPVGVLPGRDEGPGAAWFGVVGAAIGVLGAIPVLVLGAFQPWAAAVLAVAIAAIVSGALHLDGLADTADALAPPDPQRADLARRDPRTGPAGVAAVVLVLLLDVTAFAVLVSPSEWAALTFVCALAASRGVLPLVAVMVGRRGNMARPGLAGWFVSHVSIRAAAFSAASTAIPGVIALVALGWRGPLVASLAGLIGGIAAAAVISRLRHGLDGDGYGAVAELATPIALLASSAVFP